jgi:aspartate/methionine/tyrosine aminotransferase
MENGQMMINNILPANRLDTVNEYYFSAKLQEIEEMTKAGHEVLNLGIGSPDLPPHPDVVSALHYHSSQPQNHAYQSYRGTALLREAIAGFYKFWYGVSLDSSSEILPLIGSKEGIMHICMSFLNHGDEALIPNPGYPTYASAIKLAGGIPVAYDLVEENDWIPDFERLAELVTPRTKLLFVNYPHMPTGQPGNEAIFEDIIAFALERRLLVCHDNPYSFILNPKPASILAVSGAKSCTLELNSLSKSHNMAGWRVGMVSGGATFINRLLQFKSNMDSGMFFGIQAAAAVALMLDADWFHQLNIQYEARRQEVYHLMDTLGCVYSRQQCGMFLWAAVPERYKDGFTLSDDLLAIHKIFVTPGGIFGSAGNAYVRISLCNPKEKLAAAKERMNHVNKF